MNYCFTKNETTVATFFVFCSLAVLIFIISIKFIVFSLSIVAIVAVKKKAYGNYDVTNELSSKNTMGTNTTKLFTHQDISMKAGIQRLFLCNPQL